MQSIHHLFDRSIPIPPVDVKNVNIRCAQFLQAGFNADPHWLQIISNVIGLDGDIGCSTFVVGRILGNCQQKITEFGVLRSTFVAITNWSRIPRDSIHSPINSSEDSSWLESRKVNWEWNWFKARLTSCLQCRWSFLRPQRTRRGAWTKTPYPWHPFPSSPTYLLCSLHQAARERRGCPREDLELDNEQEGSLVLAHLPKVLTW